MKANEAIHFGLRVGVLTVVCGASAFAVWHFGGRPIVDEHSIQWRQRLDAIRTTSATLAKDIAYNNAMLAECKAAMDTVERLSRSAREVAKTCNNTMYAADSASHAAHQAAATANRLTADIGAFSETLDNRFQVIMRRLDAIDKRLTDAKE